MNSACDRDALEACARDALNPADRLTFEEHLSICETCRDELEWLRPLLQAIQDAGPDPSELADRVLAIAAFAADKGQPEGRHPRRKRRLGRARPSRGSLRRRIAWLVAAGLLAAGLLRLGHRALQDPRPIAKHDPSPANSDTPETDTPEPDTPEPDTPEPDTSEPDTPEPDTPEPSRPQPVAPEPDAHKSDPLEPNTRETPNVPDDPEPVTPDEPTVPRPKTVPKRDDPASARARGTLLASVERRKGKVSRERPGGPWGELSQTDTLRPGDRVRTERGCVELLLPEHPEQLASTGVGLGSWLTLGARSQAKLGSGGADIQLEKGKCLVRAYQALQVRVGACVATVYAGFAELSVSATGTCMIVVNGEVLAETPLGRERLKGRKRLRVRSKGELGRPREAKALLPAWAAAFDAGFVTSLDEGFSNPPNSSLELGGTLDDGVARGEADPYDNYAQRVHLGRTQTRGGLFRFAPGTRIRVRFRLSSPARVKLQILNATQGINFHGDVPRALAGVWIELVFRLADLEDVRGEGRRIADGDVFPDLSLYAGRVGTPLLLEVDRLTVLPN